jgi:predicted acylesterase/phospholipase RssA
VTSDSILAARLATVGPKRLLALDGGGIRGLVTLGYLQAIERILRERYQRPEYRLADYFDFIGGTSTGAIIATLLSLGWNVADVTRAYIELAEEVFKPNRYWGLGPIGRIFASRFEAAPMERVLRQLVGEVTLDSPNVRTGLMIIAKRVDTASVWPIVNLPSHLYFNDRVVEQGRTAAGNRHFKLWELLRASTAAPTMFRPKRISEIRVLQSAVFVDGAISTHNDPALQLLMAATLDGFGLNWPLGADRLLLCSVGTGRYKMTAPLDSVEKFTNLAWAQLLVPQLIGDSMNLIETILQWLSLSPTARSIDRTIGKVAPKLGGSRGLLHYLRYNIELQAAELEKIGVDLRTQQILAMRNMSDVNTVPHLLDVGAKVGACVTEAHFPPAFDPEDCR